MEYEDIFEIRGNRYHGAMLASPFARDEEFQNIFRRLDWSKIKSMLDYPSGGDYTSHLIPFHVAVTSMDPCKVFSAASAKVAQSQLVNLADLPGQDLIICVATLHHCIDKAGYLLPLARKLNPGGRLCIADVAAGSTVERYLETFVHEHTSTGHRGQYISANQPPELTGFELTRSEVVACPWRFGSRQELCEFGRELFGLENVTVAEVFTALQSSVGVRQDSAGWCIDWELLYLEYQNV